MSKRDDAWLDGWFLGFLACYHLMAPNGRADEWFKLRDEMLARRTGRRR